MILLPDVEYRGYRIYYEPPPIPIRSHDWQFAHKEWDLGDKRIGSAGSLKEAQQMIDELEDEDG